MTGPERSLFYRLAIETGLRLSELQAARVADVDPQAPGGPTITVHKTKNGKSATLPLIPLTANLLLDLAADRLSTAPLFRSYRQLRAAEMLRVDLQRAGIPYASPSGVVDFHALRTTCATRLFRAGVHVRQAQAIMRHSTIALTMDTYTRLDSSSLRSALAALPSLGSTGS